MKEIPNIKYVGDEKPEYRHPDEMGLSIEVFREKQKIIKEKSIQYSVEDINRPQKIYLNFDSKEIKEKVLKLIDEYREYDEAFTFLNDWKSNKQHEETGLELSFTKSPESSVKKILDFFNRNQIDLNNDCYLSRLDDSGEIIETKEIIIEPKDSDKLLQFKRNVSGSNQKPSLAA